MIALYYEHYFDSHCLYFENVSNGCDYCVVSVNKFRRNGFVVFSHFSYFLQPYIEYASITQIEFGI